MTLVPTSKVSYEKYNSRKLYNKNNILLSKLSYTLGQKNSEGEDFLNFIVQRHARELA
jgi:hypothetical protein